MNKILTQRNCCSPCKVSFFYLPEEQLFQIVMLSSNKQGRLIYIFGIISPEKPPITISMLNYSKIFKKHLHMLELSHLRLFLLDSLPIVQSGYFWSMHWWIPVGQIKKGFNLQRISCFRFVHSLDPITTNDKYCLAGCKACICGWMQLGSATRMQ